MYRVRMTGTGWTGAPSLNTWYFDQGGADDQEAADLSAQRVQDALLAGNGIYGTNTSHTVQPEVDVINPVTGELENTYSTPPLASVGGGSGAFEILPTATAMLLQLRTGDFTGGKRLRGRSYLSPVSGTTTQGDGTPTAAAGILARAFGAALLDEGALGGPRLVVWGRPSAPTEKNPDLPTRAGRQGIVTAITVPDMFAVLRSRRD